MVGSGLGRGVVGTELGGMVGSGLGRGVVGTGEVVGSGLGRGVVGSGLGRDVVGTGEVVGGEVEGNGVGPQYEPTSVESSIVQGQLTTDRVVREASSVGMRPHNSLLALRSILSTGPSVCPIFDNLPSWV